MRFWMFSGCSLALLLGWMWGVRGKELQITMSSNIPWANSWYSLRWGRPLDERVWGWRSAVQFWVSWGLGSITMFVGGCLSREWELNVLHIACVCNHLFYSTPLFSVLVFFVRSFTEIFSIRENRVLWSLGVNFLLALPLLLTSCLLHYWLNWKSTGTHNLGTLFFFFGKILKWWSFGTACSVTQSYPALCSPMDCSPPGSFVSGILQARTLEWVAIKRKTLKKMYSYFNLSGDVTAQIALQPALKFNGGGHINHSIFWTNLSPNGGGEPQGWFKLGQPWLHFVHSRNDLIFLSYLHSPWGIMMASFS